MLVAIEKLFKSSRAIVALIGSETKLMLNTSEGKPNFPL